MPNEFKDREGLYRPAYDAGRCRPTLASTPRRGNHQCVATANHHPDCRAIGKKRLERNAAIRGQVMLWQRLLVDSGKSEAGLFDKDKLEPILTFETLPLIQLSQAVPESSWTHTDPRAKEMESRDLFEEEGVV